MNTLYRLFMTACLLLSMIASHAQSDDRNYILSRTYTGAAQYIEDIVYHDGLGRPIQTVRHGASPSGDDIVTNRIYDGLGRVVEDWLAGTSGQNGDFVSHEYLMNRTIPLHDNDIRSFTRYRYESSTDGRPISQQQPGEAWLNDDRKVKYEYCLNSHSGELACLRIVKSLSDRSSDLISIEGLYDDGCLDVTKVTDEDNRVSMTFINGLGQTVMERIVLSDSKFLDTYYVYDLYGNLCMVLPPMASAKLQASSTEFEETLNDYAYIYGYDMLNRCVRKKLPGADWIYYCYDRAGHCLFTQDGELRKVGKWRFSIPDAHGRVVMTGICSNTNTCDFTDKTVRAVFNENESLNGSGYTISNLLLANPEFHVILYYDSYDFMKHVAFSQIKTDLAYKPLAGYTHWTFAYEGKEISKRGLITGKRVYSLGQKASMTATAYYYDQWNHISQEVSVNPAEKVSVREWRSCTMTGLPLRRCRNIKKGAYSVDEQYAYTYDHDQRLLTVKHRVANMPEVTLLSNDYDDLGRLRAKALCNGTDSVSYKYNVRDWTTSVKSSDFTQHLHYNTGQGEKQYGGFVSKMLWGHGGEAMHGYVLSYDGAGRLTSGEYREYENGSVVGETTGRYDEAVTEYDLNGNVMSLSRKGMTGPNEYGVIDLLSMTVDGNKVSSVHNDVSGSTSVYSYDTNGRVVSDSSRGVLSVGYNSLSLPERVEFADGAITSYVYDAEGRKLRTVFQTQDRTVTTDYCRGLLFENDVPTMLLTETGYFALTDSLYRHYIHDHQGNVRVVKREDGIVEETNDYYPFGGQIETISQGDVQPFKYSGKEIETRHGIGWYDFGARRYDHDLARWTTMDPLSEKYYSVSPYAFCNNNPVNFVDPDGMAWYYNITTGAFVAHFDDNDDHIYMLTQEQIIKADGRKIKLDSFRNDYNMFGQLALNDQLDNTVAHSVISDLFEKVNTQESGGKYIEENISIIVDPHLPYAAHVKRNGGLTVNPKYIFNGYDTMLLLAHEIGHLVDIYANTLSDDKAEREKSADTFAKSHWVYSKASKYAKNNIEKHENEYSFNITSD